MNKPSYIPHPPFSPSWEVILNGRIHNTSPAYLVAGGAAVITSTLHPSTSTFTDYVHESRSTFTSYPPQFPVLFHRVISHEVELQTSDVALAFLLIVSSQVVAGEVTRR